MDWRAKLCHMSEVPEPAQWEDFDLAMDLSQAEEAFRESAEVLDLARDLFDVAKVLRKEGDGWVLRSRDGTKILKRWKSKPSEEEIAKREREVEFFKHQK